MFSWGQQIGGTSKAGDFREGKNYQLSRIPRRSNPPLPMPRKYWSTPAQRAWLDNRIPAYHEAQELHNLSDFYIETYRAFFVEFPLAPACSGGGDEVRADPEDKWCEGLVSISRTELVRLTFPFY